MADLPEVVWTPVFIPNPDRRWWQVWKPSHVLNPEAKVIMDEDGILWDELAWKPTEQWSVARD